MSIPDFEIIPELTIAPKRLINEVWHCEIHNRKMKVGSARQCGNCQRILCGKCMGSTTVCKHCKSEKKVSE